MMCAFDTLILARGIVFIGQGYVYNVGLFVLDATYEVANNVESASTCTYIIESLKCGMLDLGI